MIPGRQQLTQRFVDGGGAPLDAQSKGWYLDFVQPGDSFSSTYEAKVRPWFFWSETGRITIKLPAADLTRLALGQTVEFTGEAANHKNKPRTVTGRAQPANPLSGKIKVRIMADGIELIFNGTYQLTAGAGAK